MRMIDSCGTPRDLRRCCTLVVDHIRANEEPDLNRPLVDALLLRFATLVETGVLRDRRETQDIGHRVLQAFYTDPPSQPPTVGALR